MKRPEKTIRRCTDSLRVPLNRSSASGARRRIRFAGAVVEGLERRTLLSFTPAPGSPLAVPTGTHPGAGAAADFNSDGIEDIAVADAGSNQVTLFFGQGDGTFSAPFSFPAGPNPTDIAVGNFNNLQDSFNDVVVTNDGTPGFVTVLFGNGI